uniref:Uncharacterized protein n=1 Tax=Romanomermis culicivorax TaxID=13658 RepID=A0A915K9K7_ROMCU
MCPVDATILGKAPPNGPISGRMDWVKYQSYTRWEPKGAHANVVNLIGIRMWFPSSYYRPMCQVDVTILTRSLQKWGVSRNQGTKKSSTSEPIDGRHVSPTPMSKVAYRFRTDSLAFTTGQCFGIVSVNVSHYIARSFGVIRSTNGSTIKPIISQNEN